MQVLIVEDNPDLMANVFDYLEARHHVVDAAYDAPGGLERALRSEYDAIVLDLMLPGGDGLDVCRRIRAQGRSTPVLMLTARDTLSDKLAGFDAGADDYLVKPFALQEARGPTARARAPGAGRWVSDAPEGGGPLLDLETRRVERGGRVIELPPIPLRILELLMRHSPRVVTRAEIERWVWGDAPPDSDALRTHLYVLRSAIDRPFEKSLLRTLRALGCQLADPDDLST